jgi:hypothetical protein
MVVIKNEKCEKIYGLIDEIEKTLNNLKVKEISDHDMCLGFGKCDGVYEYRCGFGTNKYIMYLDIVSKHQEIYEISLKAYERYNMRNMIAEYIIKTDNHDLIVKHLERIIKDLW